MALTNKQLQDELEKQNKALAGLKVWMQNLFLIAFLGVVFCVCGFNYGGIWRIVGIVGAIVTVIAVLLLALVMLGFFRGKKNVKNMEQDLNNRLKNA